MKLAILIVIFSVVFLSVHSVDATPALTITTDKAIYTLTDVIQLTVNTSEIIPYTSIQYEIINSQDVITRQGNIYPDDTNTAITNIQLNALITSGSYTIQAKYGDGFSSSSITIYDEDLDLSKLSISADAGYLLGETITLTGKLNGFWIPALDIMISQVTTQSTIRDISGLLFETSDVVRLDGYGSFTYSFDIPDDPIHLGTYYITVYGDSLFSDKLFSVVKDLDDITMMNSSLVINTDKLAYSVGDDISVSGQLDTLVSEPADLITVGIYRDGVAPRQSSNIKHSTTGSEYTIDYSHVSLPDAAGRFSFSDTLYPNIFQPGKYILVASTSLSGFTTSTTFEIKSDNYTLGGIDLNFNKKIINNTDTMSIEGFVPGVSQGIPIFITLTMPDATQLKFNTFADDFTFFWEWTVPTYASEQDQENLFGIYRIDVDTEKVTATDFFKVSKNPENDSIDLNYFEISSDKLFYTLNEPIVISGKIPAAAFMNPEFSLNDPVTIKIQTSAFATLDTSNVIMEQNGAFTSSFLLNPFFSESGSYIVSAIFSDYTVKHEFAIYDKFSIPISVSTDRLYYNPNDIVSVTLNAPQDIKLSPVDVSIYASVTSSNCDVMSCTLINSSTISDIESDSTTFTFTIPNDTIYTTYQINVQKSNAKYSTVFFTTPITPTTSDPKDVSYLKLVKSDRITDDSIPLKIENILLDSKIATPLVVRGSLFTPIRDANSDVNLRVEHNSGMCIIGQTSECKISDTTRGVDTLYTIIQIDGIDYNVRYNGPDSILEQFSILDSLGNPLSKSMWNVTIDSEHPTRFYYTILYSVE